MARNGSRGPVAAPDRDADIQLITKALQSLGKQGGTEGVTVNELLALRIFGRDDKTVRRKLHLLDSAGRLQRVQKTITNLAGVTVTVPAYKVLNP